MKRHDWIMIACLVAGLYLTYSIVLRIPFAFHNDLGVLTYVHGSGHFEDWPEGRQLIPIGRSLNALLANYQFTFIREIPDFTMFRALSLAIIAVMTIAFWSWLARFAMDAVSAAGAALLVALLPSVQLSILWNTQLVPGVLPMLLILAAAALLHTGPAAQAEGLRQGIGRQMLARWLFASLLLVLANFIYPPTAAIILLPTLACVLFLPASRWSATRLLVIRDVTIYAASCILYFFLQKTVVGPLVRAFLQREAEGHGDPTFKLQLASDLPGNVAELFSAGGAIALHLWDLTFSWWSLAAVLGVLLAGVAAEVRRQRTLQPAPISAGTWVQYCTAIGGLIIAGNAPNLISPKPLIAFRVLFVLSAMIALLLFRAVLSAASLVRESDRLFFQRTLFIALAVVVAATAQSNLAGAVINTHSEMEVLRSWFQKERLREQMVIATSYRGVPRDVRISGRPTQHIDPRGNLLGVNLPLEFGLWYKREEALEFLAREQTGIGVDRPFSMDLFLADVWSREDVWVRPNPWPQQWYWDP